MSVIFTLSPLSIPVSDLPPSVSLPIPTLHYKVLSQKVPSSAPTSSNIEEEDGLGSSVLIIMVIADVTTLGICLVVMLYTTPFVGVVKQQRGETRTV